MTTISQHHNNIAESINYSPFNWEFDIRFVGWIHQRKGTKAIDFDWWCRVQRYVRPWTICVCVDNSNSKGNYRKSPTIQRTVKIKSATTFSPLSSFFGFASVFSFNPMLMWDVQAFLRTDFEGCVWVFVNELRKNVNGNLYVNWIYDYLVVVAFGVFGLMNKKSSGQICGVWDVEQRLKIKTKTWEEKTFNTKYRCKQVNIGVTQTHPNCDGVTVTATTTLAFYTLCHKGNQPKNSHSNSHSRALSPSRSLNRINDFGKMTN